MKINNVVMTNQGLALLAAASSVAPLSITRIDVGQTVAEPVADEIRLGAPAATTIALVKYSITTNIFTSRNLSGKHVAVRGVIPAFSNGYWVLQLGIYSGATLIAIASVAAAPRTLLEQEYTVLLPVSDLNKVVFNRNSLSVSTRAAVAANTVTMQAELDASMPKGKIGSVYAGITTGVTTKRLVEFISVMANQASANAEIARITALVPRPVSYTVISRADLFIAKLKEDGQWTNTTAANAAAFYAALSLSQIFFDKQTGKSYITTPSSLIRIFNAPE